MKAHPVIDIPDPLPLWEAELRALVVQDLSAEAVGDLTATALGASLTATAAAGTAALEGGTIMSTSASIGVEAATSLVAKITAGCAAATLAVGGTLAATGNLPDGAQKATADAAAHIGITLPRPAAEVGGRGSIDASADTIVTVANAGRVGVTVEGHRLVLTGIEAEGAFTAHVVSQTDDAIVIEFGSAAEKTTVLLTAVEGRVVSSIVTEAHSQGGASGDEGSTGLAEADARAGGSAESRGSVESEGSSGSAEAESEAEVEARLRVRIGG